MQPFVYNNIGYDQFIDFLKGLSIIFVVLTHSIPFAVQQMIGFPFWGAQAVPLFLLIQSYHYFKREKLPQINLAKLFQRIILPFIIVQLLALVFIVISYFCGSGILTTPIMELIKYGGKGPGSYYFWIYLQFALILLPMFGWMERQIKMPVWAWGVVFAVSCELLEIFCSFIHVSSEVYRLLSVRYFFLIYGGYIWAKVGVNFNFVTFLLSIISLIAIFLLQYRHLTFEPWIFDSDWRYFHWFCYFYSFWLLVIVANLLYRFLSRFGCGDVLKFAGKYSYHIYILQMLVFFVVPQQINARVYFFVTTFVSIVPVLLFYMINEKYKFINTNNV